MTRSHAPRLALLSLMGAALVSLSAGCSAPQAARPGFRQPVRAVWVTRGEFRSPADIDRIMQNCSESGFNTVVFQVRGNGTVFYPSKIEPWAEQYGFKDPGFDPLRVAIDAAHARKLELHAWVNAMPAWRGTRPPSEPRQIYNTHPEWFWYDQKGVRQPLTDFYVSLNPCLPEVRSYLTSVMQEIVANYNVDGLHLDYIRFPNEPPAIREGSGIDYPRDAKTLELYKKATGLAPDDNKESWNQWRCEQVTQVVRDIRHMMLRVRPAAALSASVGTNQKASLEHFRDELKWAEEGLVDGMFPMNYKPDLPRFEEGLAMWKVHREGMAVVPGIWFDSRVPADQSAQVVRQQIEHSIAKTGNFCLFSYASLFAGMDEPVAMSRPAGSQPSGRRGRLRGAGREQRRKELVPFIQSLAGKGQVAMAGGVE